MSSERFPEASYGAVVSEDHRTIGVYVEGTAYAMYRTERPIDIDAWAEILDRHFEASMRLDQEDADGWMFVAFAEVRKKYGGQRIMPVVEMNLPIEGSANE